MGEIGVYLPAGRELKAWASSILRYLPSRYVMVYTINGGAENAPLDYFGIPWVAVKCQTPGCGGVSPGKFADFIVYNKDYFTIPEADIPTVFPLMVVVGGKTVVLREEYAKELGTPPVGPQLKFSWEPLKPRTNDFNALDYLNIERRAD